MHNDLAIAGHRPPDGTRAALGNAVVERAVALVLAGPAVRHEAVRRGRTLLASSQWCRADEVAAELVRCYAGRLVP